MNTSMKRTLEDDLNAFLKKHKITVYTFIADLPEDLMAKMRLGSPENTVNLYALMGISLRRIEAHLVDHGWNTTSSKEEK